MPLREVVGEAVDAAAFIVWFVLRHAWITVTHK